MDSRDALIEELRATIAKQAVQVERLTRRVAELELELAKAKKDSSTSSKPPSGDIVKPPPRKQSGTRKKRFFGNFSGWLLVCGKRLAENVDHEPSHRTLPFVVRFRCCLGSIGRLTFSEGQKS
jgi:uncharacterized coiled-coil protein SlyX